MEIWLVQPDELMRLLGIIEARLGEMEHRLSEHFSDEEEQGRKLDQISLDVNSLQVSVTKSHASEHTFVQQLIKEKETQNTLRQKLIEAIASRAVLVILGAAALLVVSLIYPEAVKWFK